MRVPPKQQPGPSPGGPDLTALALQASDFGGAGLPFEAYFVDAFDPTALSAYEVRFNGLLQQIEWCPTANQASFLADFWANNRVTFYNPVQLDLSGIGDGARGFFDPAGGFSQVVLSSGKLMEYIAVQKPTLQASDLQNLAQTAANYINAAGLGS